MPSLNRVQLIGRLPKEYESITIENELSLTFNLNVETKDQAVFPIGVSGKLADYCKNNWREDCLVYLEGELYINKDDPQGSHFVIVTGHKVKFLEHEPPNKYTSGNIDKIELVVHVLEALRLDPHADHKMISRIINELNSIDFDDID